jgi:hypothetical protein
MEEEKQIEISLRDFLTMASELTEGLEMVARSLNQNIQEFKAQVILQELNDER